MMALSFLLFIGVLFLVVTAYVAGLVLVRQRLGTRHQHVYNAVLQTVLALLLDAGVLYFSISFCTAATSDALRLRGRGAQNQLLDSLSGTFGAGSVDNATLWGLIIPAFSWATAHAVVVLGLLLARAFYQAVTTRQAAQAAEPDSEDHKKAKSRLEGALAAILGCGIVLALSVVAFRFVVLFDTLLVRYQIIHSSRALTKALGKDWMARLSEQQLYAKLGNTFLGQIVIHAGTFYVVALLVAAFLVAVAIHNLLHHLGTLPGRRYNPGPPPLDVPAGVWNGPPVTVRGTGFSFGTNGAGPEPAATAGPAAARRAPEPEWYRAATEPGSDNGSRAATHHAPAPPIEPNLGNHPAVDVPLETPATVADAEVERLALAPSE